VGSIPFVANPDGEIVVESRWEAESPNERASYSRIKRDLMR
jgi:hypothetical protein